MNHVATITKTSRLPALPFHVQCSCGTAGTFGDVQSALAYANNHGMNVKSAGGVNTFELVDNSNKPESKVPLPSSNVGVGPMPTSHAPLQEKEAPKVSSAPPPPPPPPDAK